MKNQVCKDIKLCRLVNSVSEKLAGSIFKIQVTLQFFLWLFRFWRCGQ